VTDPISIKLNTALTRAFLHKPTADQQKAIDAFCKFLGSPVEGQVFLLKGYAGTGKTSLIRSLVKALPQFKLKTSLLAPTGRAAKVITQYSGKYASTIHRHIYRLKSGGGFTPGFILKENKAYNTVYIVDEASMIGAGNSAFEGQSLLSDLLQFVAKGVNCRLILVGDVGQLPPVGADNSPALDPDYLNLNYSLPSIEVVLTEVMRQDKESQILFNATVLRDQQRQQDFSIPRFVHGHEVHHLIDGYSIEDALNDSYRQVGREGTIVVVRSNKRANLYNKQIRMRILWQEDRISTGDFLMVVKNNYFWLPEKSQAGFIANGDILEVIEIFEFKDLYGFEFARVQVRMVDYPNQDSFEVMLNLRVLDLEAASLSWPDMNRLYSAVEEDYTNIKSKYKRRQKMKEDPYYNALQVKFAYAVTAHKSQGGQWRNVFVEKPWFPEGKMTMEDFRWLYTSFTRAQDNLYLIGFDEAFVRDF
jgi:exodeoxyribonuclease-5